MTRRLILVGLLVATEALALSVLGGPALLRWLAGAVALFTLLLYARPLSPLELPRLHAGWAVAHGLFVLLLARFATNQPAAAMLSALAVATALFTALPLPTLRWATAQVRWHAGCTALGTIAGAGLAAGLGRLEEPLTGLTFLLTRDLLSLFLHPLIVDPAGRHLGTSRFRIELLPACSGIEGILLFLLFFGVWCLVFRGELRWRRALVLLPLGLLVTYGLNVLRIAATLLIGHAGWPQVATGGFHEYAGWIAYLAVAFVWLMAASRLPWLWVTPNLASEPESPASPYLLPFLGILAAGILTGALAAGFEWAYVLRVLTAGAILWAFRHRYRTIDWRFRWTAPAIGAAVFLLWLLADLFLPASPAGMPAPLADSPPWMWIFARIAGAVVTVPIAEELAFRGFLLRRLSAAEFDTVSWMTISKPALVISSLVFGVLHTGPHLGLGMAATVAGLVYGLVLSRRGRLGESVAAHATTNALLAGYVLSTGRWDLW